MAVRSSARALAYHAHTLFLFTQSNLHTTFFPILFFGIAAAPIRSPSGAFHAALWLWLHLLQFDVANQIHAIAEDKLNKPYRPLPAGRISLRSATRLRWATIPACLLLSILYSYQALYASATFTVLVFVYNELHADAGHWLLRDIMNGAGFAAFEWGTTLLAGADWEHLDAAAALAVFHGGAVFATTIQVQDFRDVVGDRIVGRKTFPIVAERAARFSVIATVVPWSVMLARVWELDALTAAAFVLLGVVVGARFLLYRTVADDAKSYKIYNIWLSFVHVLVGYWRYRNSSW